MHEVREVRERLIGDKVEIFQSGAEELERNFRFNTGERRAHTEVNASSECEVGLTKGAIQIKAIRFGELGGVSIGRGKHQKDLGALWNFHPVYLDLPTGRPHHALDRRVHAEYLFHRVRDEARSVQQVFPPRTLTKQEEEGVPITVLLSFRGCPSPPVGSVL